MALQTWWLYVTAVFLISATPGPNMLHVMVQSIHHGARRSVASMAGLMIANLVCLLASATGLGALLKASPMLFEVLRYAGVAYLLWLGIKAWRAPVGGSDSGEAPRTPSLTAMVAAGLGTGFSNPKLILFAAALFPQFIDRPSLRAAAGDPDPQLCRDRSILVHRLCAGRAFALGLAGSGQPPAAVQPGDRDDLRRLRRGAARKPGLTFTSDWGSDQHSKDMGIR